MATAGIFDNWVKSCPLHYTSPNASRVRDVLGTLMLGILSGSKRYAHLAGIRGDQVAAQALGLDKIVSEDSVRRALGAMDPEAAQSWMQQALKDSVIEALDRSWILDLDTTTQVPVRPSRGCRNWLQPTHWQAIEDKLRLAGWSKERRVVVLRRPIKRDVALTHSGKDGQQQVLALGWDEVQDEAQLWEYTVLVTDVDYELSAIGQLYRDRCDCENGFDELKNQ